MKTIDLRSDTVTQPTDDMRNAMFTAVVGDDVVGEDPTVNRLEKLAAQMLGKEAALFVPSGTFGNQLAVHTHCPHGSELIIPEQAHIVQYEVAAAAVIAGVQLRAIRTQTEWLTWEDIEPTIRKDAEDVHLPETGLIVLQNSTGKGAVMPFAEMQKIWEGAKKYNLPIHIDGARIFNAATYLEVNVKEIAKLADSVMFCLSKGLAAPVGSLLVGTEEFIKKARKKRKLMGGGMRQVGILAAPGIIALEKMTKRLHKDHSNAKKLAEALSKYEIFDISANDVQTNIFFLKFKEQNEALGNKFVEELAKHNVLTYPPREGSIRFVTHNDVSEADIDFIISKLLEIVETLS